MKETRLIVFISLLFLLLGLIFYLLCKTFPNLIVYIDIVTNLYCGIIVGLITSICQYCSSKRKIINNIYNAYFDFYRCYYYSKNKKFMGHYSSYNVYKKMEELNLKVIEALDEYHGIFKKNDRTYKKLNPNIKLKENYKVKYMSKSLFTWFNKKAFINSFEPFVKEVENILININEKRFKKDKEEMIKLYNFIWSVKNEKWRV